MNSGKWYVVERVEVGSEQSSSRFYEWISDEEKVTLPEHAVDSLLNVLVAMLAEEPEEDSISPGSVVPSTTTPEVVTKRKEDKKITLDFLAPAPKDEDGISQG